MLCWPSTSLRYAGHAGNIYLSLCSGRCSPSRGMSKSSRRLAVVSTGIALHNPRDHRATRLTRSLDFMRY
jgi:hypothetical protein